MEKAKLKLKFLPSIYINENFMKLREILMFSIKRKAFLIFLFHYILFY